MMSYEKLDVYQCSIDFLGIAIQTIEEFPRGSSILVDQFKRAAISIPLNIGEGAGKRTKPDCRKFFDIARGSAMECGAILDVCSKLKILQQEKYTQGKALLERIVAMLTKLADTQA
jgi:four helix bundle protein